MKNIIAIILMVAITIGILVGSLNARTEAELAAAEASALEEISSDVTVPDFPYLTINTEAFTVAVEDGYDTAGVTTFICDTTANYSFTSDNDEVTWDVYVLDVPFEDEVRYLNQAETAVLSGNGNVEIEKGKYIYLACSCNGFTSDEPLEAILSINYVEE